MKVQNIVNGMLYEGEVLTGRIGYVYPNDEESYYVNSNLGSLITIELEDGFCYAEVY